ncbi:ATP-binding protein [Bradyrhizobium sp. ARR65]|uniref:sensor histidine kinase n=1 Tax=Bradyrhizobium sp. ARR65 TaxID=1040989 RepID=UPI000465A237|nr:ATP-binding protein [Bradyrhizobium sp. ARR65]
MIVLHSYGQNFKPWGEYAKALRQELESRSKWALDVQDFSVITARSEDEGAEVEFSNYLRALFSHQAPDLIVAFGAPAGAFVQRHRAQLFPNAPVVLSAIDQRRVQESALTRNDTVVAVRQDVPVLFGNILRLLPETKTIAVVIGDSPNERFWIAEMNRKLEPLRDRVQFVFLNNLSFEDVLKRAASLPPHSAIWWNQPQVDAVGAVHEGERALKELYAVADAPIFSYDDSFLRGEIVGGPMTSAADGARATANVALRILAGETPGDITTPVLQYGAPKYDWRQLQRWGISEALLPPGSQIYFREPTIWEKYGWQIALASLIILVQSALIGRLLYVQRRRQYAESQARKRTADLARANRFSMAGELTASIAHEINQPLAAMLTNTETLELVLRSSVPDIDEAREIVADIRRDNERASEVIRRLRSLLKKTPFELKSIDLNDVVREATEFLSALTAARGVTLTSLIAPIALPIKGDKTQLQQVIVNLVTNAMDGMLDLPTGKRRITISTQRADDLGEISVADAGPGIPPEKAKDVFEPFFTTKPQGMGMGLSIARTIIEAHQGQVFAESQTIGGAVFRIRLPLVLGNGE